MSSNDDTVRIVGNRDRRRPRERLLGVCVEEVPPTEARPVDPLDLPPVRVAVLAVIGVRLVLGGVGIF